MCHRRGWARALSPTSDAIALFQIDIVFGRACATGQGELEHDVVRRSPGWQSVEIESEVLNSARLMFDELRHRKRPIQRRALGKQICVISVRGHDIDKHTDLAVAPNVANG